MKRMKLFIKFIGYSFRLIHRSSKLMILLYLALNLICATFPLFSEQGSHFELLKQNGEYAYPVLKSEREI